MQAVGSGEPDDQEWLVMIQLLIALLDLLKGIGPS